VDEEDQLEYQDDPPDLCLTWSPRILKDQPNSGRSVMTYECELMHGHRGLHAAFTNRQFTNEEPLYWDNRNNLYIGDHIINEDPV
jgi:hypothetical protein